MLLLVQILDDVNAPLAMYPDSCCVFKPVKVCIHCYQTFDRCLVFWPAIWVQSIIRQSCCLCRIIVDIN